MASPYPTLRTNSFKSSSDLEKGKKCAINEINGKFVEMGHKVGISVPFMQTVVDVVTKLQKRELKLDEAWGNLEYVKVPELQQKNKLEISEQKLKKKYTDSKYS